MRASVRDKWAPVTKEEQLAATMMGSEDTYRREFREGWSAGAPRDIIYSCSYKGVRPRSLCSDRTRRWCARNEGRCMQTPYYSDDTRRRKAQEEAFAECKRYCLQMEITLVERDKELKTRPKKEKKVPCEVTITTA